MEEFTKIDLRNARDARKMPRWKLGNAVGVSEDTIARWEDPDDTAMPTPDDIDRIGEALEDETIWHRWMVSNCDSYRKRYINVPDYSLPISINRVRHVINDIMELQDQMERDAMDGKIDDRQLGGMYEELLKMLVASASHVREKL